MKRRMTISIAFVLGVVVLSLMSSGATVHARKERLFSFDTGIISLGPNQRLRVVTDNKDPDIGYVVRFTRMAYSGAAEGEGVRYTIESQSTSDAIAVAPGEGFSI